MFHAHQSPDSPSPDRNRLATEAHAALKAAIIRGELQPRERLYGTVIAKHLKMSRTPVREALRVLVSEGLAEVKPDGLYVRALTVQDVRELEQANRALQSMAAELAASTGSDSDMEALEELTAHMEACAQKHDANGWVAVDQKIRRHLLQMAGNRWITQLLLQLEPLIGRVHHISFRRPGRMEQSTCEHRSIVDAVKSRDAKAARQAMHEHLLLVEQNVIEILETFVVPWEGDRL